MRNRSNLLVLLGIAFFVVGGIIVYVLTNDSDDGGSAVPSAVQPVTVVVATHDIPADTKAGDAIDDGWLQEKQVPVGALLPGAIQSLAQLQGATFIQGFADGAQIVSSGLQSLQRGYDLPEGYEAIAVDLSFVQGVAGYVNVGDRINVYAAYGTQYLIDGATLPHAELLLTNVRVLDVSQTVPTNGVQADGPRAAGGSIQMLLAVRTVDAEKLVFGTNFESLYATLVRDDAGPSAPTDGVNGDNILAIDPATSAA